MAAKKVLNDECVFLVKRRSRRGRAVCNRILPCFKPARDYAVRGGVGVLRVALCRRHAVLVQKRGAFTVEAA